MVCSKCNDKKHIKEGEQWISCSCLEEQRFSYLYENSDADLTYFNTTIEKDFNPKTQEANQAIEEVNHIKSLIEKLEIPKKPVCFISRYSNSRFIFAYDILKSFIKKDLSAKVVSVDDLFEIFINREKERTDSIKQFITFDVVMLNIGLEFSNKAAPHLIKTLYRLRKEKEKFTILTSRYPVSQMKLRYDEEVEEIFKDLRLIHVFDLD